MKKTILIFLILLIAVTAFTACSQDDDTSGGDFSESSLVNESQGTTEDDASKNDVSETEASENDTSDDSKYVFVPHTEYVPNPKYTNICYGSEECICDGKHSHYFLNDFLYDKESFYSEFGISEFYANRFFTYYYFSDDYNLGFLLEYFDISKEDYIAYLDKIVNESNVQMIDENYPYFRYVNGLYSENYMEEEKIINSQYEKKGETYYAQNRDGIHNSIYYTIDYRLIDHVGEEKFNEYLSNTDDVNILSFIDYFDIDWYTFSGVINKDRGNARPYNVYYVYGTEKDREGYFGTVSTVASYRPSTFIPFAHPDDDYYTPNSDGIHDPRYFVISEDIFSKVLGEEVKFTNAFLETNDFAKLYYNTENWNYGFLIEYYGVKYNEWFEWCRDLPFNYKTLEQEYDLWFNQRYEQNVQTISMYYTFPEVSTYYGEKIDSKYNSTYYKIDRKLILEVGEENFKQFLDKYEGSTDCNILKFIEEFNLNKSDFERIYDLSLPENKYRKITPYNIEKLFDDPETYFGYAKTEKLDHSAYIPQKDLKCDFDCDERGYCLCEKHSCHLHYLSEIYAFGRDVFFDEFGIENEQFEEFQSMYLHSEFYNFSFFLEYFKISKEKYISFLDSHIQKRHLATLDEEYPLLRYINGLYGENILEDAQLINSDFEKKGETYYAEKRDENYNSIYYTIDYKLINHVGKDKFNKYLSEIKDVNILSFIEYFDIDWYSFSAIMTKEKDVYSIYYLYGTEEEQKAYFGFYDNEYNVNEDLFTHTIGYDDYYGRRWDGVHDPRYFALDSGILSKINNEEVPYSYYYPSVSDFIETNDFASMHYGTESFNYGFLIEYYGITESQWREWVDELFPVEYRDYKGIEWQYDLWFNKNHEDNVMTISSSYDFPEVRTYYGEKIDDKYNSIYYKIDRKLILEVGVDRFEAFLDKYEGTVDCNVIKFIEEFGLTQKRISELYNYNERESYEPWFGFTPYNVEMMFNDTEAYFGYAK